MNHGLTYSSFPPRASFLDSNQPVFFSGTKISDNNMFLNLTWTLYQVEYANKNI